MKNATIYIEVSDEITTVIERLKSVTEANVILVVPKGAILLQSIVNLKLARKAATDSAKQIVLVTTDATGSNLALQVGIPVVTDEKAAPAALAGETSAPAEQEEAANIIAGVPVHRYYDNSPSTDEPTDASTQPEAEAPIIIPKEIMKDDAAPVVVAAAAPEIAKVEATIASTKEESKITRKKMEPAAAADPVAVSKRKKVLRYSVFVLALLLITAIGVSFLFLPKTNATLAVPSESWEKTFEFNATAAASVISEDNGTVPAELVTQEVTDSLNFKATGTKKVGDVAKGTATIYNGSDSDVITLPAGAKLVANGRTLTTDNAVTVPGVQFKNGKKIDGSINVGVTADEPGPESNMSSVAATIVSPTTSLYASIVSTTGGASRDVTVISATDVANAKTSLTNKLRDAANAQLTEKMQNRDVRFNPEADNFALADMAVTQQVGAEVEAADISSKATLKRLVIDYAFIKTANESRVMTSFSDQEGKKTTIINEPIEVASLVVGGDGGQATLTTKVTGKQSAIIPKEALRKALSGKTRSGGEALILQYVPGAKVTISHSPRWWPIKRFPYSNKYLTLTLTYE